MKRAGRMIAAALLFLALPLRTQAAELDIDGKSAVLMDVATGTVLYESNPHEPLAPASVTKVMTMLLIMEAIDSGKIGWDDMVTASEAAAALKPGEALLLENLRYYAEEEGKPRGAWLSNEYRNCGNGHYGLLLDATHAVFYEDD